MITQAYLSRCSSWRPSSKARINRAFWTLLRIKQNQARWKKEKMPFETGFPIILTSGAFLNHKPNKQTSHELQKNLDSSSIHFVQMTRWRHKTLSTSAIRMQVSRCCINFPHELTCQILTNQSIKIGRRAWPTGDHGEKSQKRLPSLHVKAGWIFVSEVKILIVRLMNTFHFICIWKNWTWVCDHLKSSK